MHAMSSAPVAGRGRLAWLTAGARALRRRKRRVILSTLILALLAWILAQSLPPCYRSEARLLVQPVGTPPAVFQATGLAGVGQTDVRTQMVLLQSKYLLHRVAERLGAAELQTASPPPANLLQAIRYYARRGVAGADDAWYKLMAALGLAEAETEADRALRKLQRGLHVSQENGSALIRVGLCLARPELAREALDLLIAEQARIQAGLATDEEELVPHLLEEELEQSRRRLSASDREWEETRAQYGIISLEEQRALLLDRLHEIERERDATERELELARVNREVLDADGAAPAEPPLLADPTLDLVKRRIAQLQIDRINLLNLYTPASTQVRKLDQEIVRLETMLREGLEARARTLADQAARIEEQLAQLETGESRQAEAGRERRLAEAEFLTFSQFLTGNRLQDAIGHAAVRLSLVEGPSLPTVPAWPPKRTIVGWGAALGLLLGLGLALMAERRADWILTARDLAEIPDVLFLGSIKLGTQFNDFEDKAHAAPAAIRPERETA